MEMSYGGTLVMPKSYAVMDQEEMCYVEGGKNVVDKGTAKTLKRISGKLMAGFATSAGSLGASAATTAATILGVPVSFFLGLGAAYCTFLANLYRSAYSWFSRKNQNSMTKYKMTTILYGPVIVDVTYGKA